MHEPRRLLLLELYRAVQAAAPDCRAAAATACAAAWQVPLELEVTEAPGPATRLAVRLVHQLEMHGMPLCVRLGPLERADGCDPALQAAIASAPLIAGRDGRLLLAVALDGAAEDCGALVDSETCARIAVAGGALESGVVDAATLLELAGDLVPPIPPVPRSTAQPCILMAALRLDAADAARCLARAQGPTIRRNIDAIPN
jgi:hypothetical protein